jgi:serine/threonine protein phosphatase PrpC
MGYAMSAVADAEQAAPELSGLATTVTMLLAHGNLGVIGHRGDSRAYLIRRSYAHQLTVDHELTEEAGGNESDDEIDVFALPLQPGDTIVLCSDGAEQVVLDDAIVQGASDVSPRILASRIVGAAHRETPSEDATAVVVRVRRPREPGWLELSLPARGTAFGHTLERT